MNQALILREDIIKFFRRFDMFFMPTVKFFAGFFVFSLIANIGLAMPLFEFLQKPPTSILYLMCMGAVCAFLSPVIIYLCIIFSLGIFLSANIEIAFVTVLFTLLVLFFYARIAPKESILILWMFFAFYFKIPYIIPIICGLYFGLTSIIPVTIGVFAWKFTPLIVSLIPAQTETTAAAAFDIMELPKTFLEVFSSIGTALFSDTGWLFTAFVFAIVIAVVYLISNRGINYAQQISILLGVLVGVISFAITGFATGDASEFLSSLLLSIPTILICLVINFFDVALDYKKSEQVTFEDDDSYYYVKIVPKVQLTEPDPIPNNSRERRASSERPRMTERPPGYPQGVERPVNRPRDMERPLRPEGNGYPEMPPRPPRPAPDGNERVKKNL